MARLRPARKCDQRLAATGEDLKRPAERLATIAAHPRVDDLALPGKKLEVGFNLHASGVQVELGHRILTLVAAEGALRSSSAAPK